MFLSLDGTAWIQLINFAIFFALLSVVFLRPVSRAIRERRAYIDGVRADLERYEREAAELRAQGDARRLAARRAAEEQVLKARSAAEEESARVAAEYGNRAGETVERARATVAEELEQARARHDELAKGLAATLLERAVGSSQ